MLSLKFTSKSSRQFKSLHKFLNWGSFFFGNNRLLRCLNFFLFISFQNRFKYESFDEPAALPRPLFILEKDLHWSTLLSFSYHWQLKVNICDISFDNLFFGLHLFGHLICYIAWFINCDILFLIRSSYHYLEVHFVHHTIMIHETME